MKKLLLPFIYARYSAYFVIPFTVLTFYIFNMDLTYIISGIIIFWVLYVSTFLILMSKLKIMDKWTNFLIKILNIKYDTSKIWKEDNKYHGLINEYPIVKVNDKKYKVSMTLSDSNLYDKDVLLRRKVLYFYIKN